MASSSNALSSITMGMLMFGSSAQRFMTADKPRPCKSTSTGLLRLEKIRFSAGLPPDKSIEPYRSRRRRLSACQTSAGGYRTGGSSTNGTVASSLRYNASTNARRLLLKTSSINCALAAILDSRLVTISITESRSIAVTAGATSVFASENSCCRINES